MKPDIDILIVQLRDGRPGTRAEAARTLAEHPSHLAKGDLIRCCDDPSDDVRYWAVWALSRLDGDVMDTVARRLEDPDGGVRMIAAKALALRPHERAVPYLLQVLDDRSDNVAYWASSALAALGNRVVPRLVKLLGAESWRKRSAAARTLVRLGGSVIPALERAMKRGGDDVRYWSLFVLGELRDRSAVPIVLPFIDSDNPELVVQAAVSLGKLGDRSVIPRMVDLLGHRDESVRLAVMDGLASFGDYSVKVLTDLLASGDRGLKVSAAASLALVGDTALGHIFEQLRAENRELRFWAVKALERFDNPAIVPVLTGLLDDDDLDIRLAAANALKRYELPASEVARLVDMLDDPNWRFRRALAESLAAQGHVALDPFLEGLRDGRDDIRFWCAWILGRMGRTEAVPGLIERFDDASWPIRKRAAESISRIGASASQELTKMLQSGRTDGNRRYWAARALIGIDDTSLLPVLIDLLGDEDWSIRRNAEEAILRFGGRAVPALLTALRTRKSRVMRQNVSNCLAVVDGLDCEHLATLFQFRDPDLNYWTANILGRRGTEAVSTLRRLVVEGEERVRHLALQAASAIEDPAIDELCLELLEDEYPSLRKMAVRILGRHKVGEAVEPLLSSLKEADEEMRLLVLAALGRIGDGRALPVLLSALKSDRWEVRKEAVEALGELGDAGAVEPLVELLGRAEESDLRPFVIRSLGRFEDPSIRTALLKVLEEAGEEDVLLAAVEALGKTGDPSVFPKLVPFLRLQSWELRKAALEAIGRLGTVPDLEPVKQAVRSEDALIRATAQRVLKKLLGEERWTGYVDRTVRKALLEPAERHYERAVELDRSGDACGAMRELRTALRCHKRPSYYILLATLHMKTRRLDLARVNLRKALRLQADHPEALGKLATVEILSGRLNKGRELLEKMLTLPGINPALTSLARRLLSRVAGSRKAAVSPPVEGSAPHG